MGIVFCRWTTWAGPTVQLIEGEAWDADDPIVQSHPDWFSPEPAVVRGTVPRKAAEAPVVEQATAAPGERRSVKRARP